MTVNATVVDKATTLTFWVVADLTVMSSDFSLLLYSDNNSVSNVFWSEDEARRVQLLHQLQDKQSFQVIKVEWPND